MWTERPQLLTLSLIELAHIEVQMELGHWKLPWPCWDHFVQNNHGTMYKKQITAHDINCPVAGSY